MIGEDEDEVVVLNIGLLNDELTLELELGDGLGLGDRLGDRLDD